MKLKQYEVVSRVEFFAEPIGDILRRYRTIKKYAYILHDKDSDASPHYHIYLNFGKSGVDSKIVAQWFGLQESQVNRIQGRATDMLEYHILTKKSTACRCISSAIYCGISSTQSVVYHQTAEDARRGVMIYSP